MYYFGKGVDKNHKEAAFWFRKAAVQGHIEAQYNLAVMYDKGYGVDKNKSEAIKWYKEAADKGHADACLPLGLEYYFGTNIPRNDVEAKRYLQFGYKNAQLTKVQKVAIEVILKKIEERLANGKQNNTPSPQTTKPSSASPSNSPRSRYHWRNWNSPDSDNRYPVGLSVGYVQKSWTKDDGKKTEDVGWWGDDPISGVQVGVRVNPQLDYGLGFNTGLFYEYYYSAEDTPNKYDSWDSYPEYKGSYSEHNLYLPLHMEYSVHFNEDFRLFASGGLGLNYIVSASETYKDKKGLYDSIEYDDIYDENDYSKFSAMWELGGALQYKNFQLRYTYARGIGSIYDEKNTEIKANKPMTIAFSIQF